MAVAAAGPYTIQYNTTVVKVDQRIRWHYTTTILRLSIGARLTRYRNCKFYNGCRTISRHADGISRYSVPPSAGPLLPLQYKICKAPCCRGFRGANNMQTICTLLQRDNHTRTPPLRFLQAGCPSCRPTNSIKALKGYS